MYSLQNQGSSDMTTVGLMNMYTPHPYSFISHAKLLTENRSTKPADNRNVTKASDLKIGQLAFVPDHQNNTFDPSYVFYHRVAGILNDSMVVLTTPDGKGRKCNIHHIKPVTALEASTNAFIKFQDSTWNTPEKKLLPSHQYNLCSKAN